MTIESWGIGHPDFTAATGRTETLANQTSYFVSFDAVIDALSSSATTNLLVVPAGKNYVNGYIELTFERDAGRVYATPLVDGYPVGQYYHIGTNSEIVYNDISGFLFPEGTILDFYIENPSNTPIHVLGNASGFIYDA